MGKKTVGNQGKAVVTKGTKHIAVAQEPDMCLVPGNATPQPFDNCVKSSLLGASKSTTVTFFGHPVCLSETQWGPPSSPKHAGTAGGVKSKAYRGHAVASSWSPDLRVEKTPVVREEDFTTHNWGPGGYNSCGKVLSAKAAGAKYNYLDVDAAVAHLQKNAHAKSKGKCARYTRQAIEAGGVTLDRTTHAKDYGPSLERAGFSSVATNATTDYAPQAGDVVVYQAVAGHPSGHMAMYDGSVWISDFKQSSMGTSTYASGDYTVYRPSQ